MKSLSLITAAILGSMAWFARSFQAAHLTPAQVHIDVPLSNICVEAFRVGDFVGPRIFPPVPVDNQSNLYYTIDKASWLRNPGTTLRAPKTSPRRVEFNVATDQYFASNYALAGENAFEVLANSDNPIALRARTARKVIEDLMRDQELRIARKVTSISNVGSGVILTGGNKWSDYTSSDPVADVSTGTAFIRSLTGLIANTLLLDWDTYQMTRRHPVILDMFKYTQGGLINDKELKEVFKVDEIIISNAIYNAAGDGGAASMQNIWGNNALLCYIDRTAPSMQTTTFGMGFQWKNPELPTAMTASVYNDPDPGKKTEVIEVGYYQDEKIVARELGYVISGTV